MQVKPSRSISQVFPISAIIRHSNININDVACFLRDIQLVRDLLYSDSWCGLSGEPDRLRGQKRPGDAAEPSRGAVPAGLDVGLCQRTLHGRCGRLSSWPTLRGFCSPKHTALYMCTMLIPSTWTLLCLPRISMHRCVNELLIIYCCFLTCWHFSVNNSVFIFCSEPFIFVLCAADDCFTWVKMPRTMVSSFYAGAFCTYFPSAKLYRPHVGNETLP